MYKITQQADQILIQGAIKTATVAALDAEIRALLKATPFHRIEIDLSQVESIDSIGVAFLDELVASFRSLNREIMLQNTPPEIAAAIRNFTTAEMEPPAKPEAIGLFERIGERALALKNNLLFLLYLTADTFYWAIIGLVDRKGQRKGVFIQQSLLIGADSVKIVSLVSLLIGFILALQSASQLRQFGANIYVADLIGIAMTAEMGPIMTAIILAGRSGSAFASEIATMMVTEEIDALKTMGLNPIRFIVVPKFHAITLCMPLLTILADIIGIGGGFIIGVTYLELSVTTFLNELLTVVFLLDIVSGIVKSLVFAWIIIIVGSYCGFTVKGGAEGVGKSTTAAVVISIFTIIVADSILGLLFYFGRPVY
jgi:phospholipid/cholesterol/gamma-HCH transport system permease protein